MQRFQSVVPVESFVSTLGFTTCELGKQHHVFFPSRVNNRSSSVFELVHSDIWDPYCVPSVKDFRYFYLFVDNFSYMTWPYLLKRGLKFLVLSYFSLMN